MKASTIRAAAAFGVLAMAASWAQASVTVVSNTSSITLYEDEAAFAAASSRIASDSFDDLAIGDLGPVLTRNLGNVSYTVAAADGLWATGTDTDTYLSTAATGSALLFAGFGNEARGLGAYVFGGNDEGGPVRGSSINITITDVTGTMVVSVDNASATDFVGFLSSVTLQSAIVAADSERYYPTMNDLSVALAPVPEPGTYAMLLAGLAVLPFAARRRRQR